MWIMFGVAFLCFYETKMLQTLQALLTLQSLLLEI